MLGAALRPDDCVLPGRVPPIACDVVAVTEALGTSWLAAWVAHLPSLKQPSNRAVADPKLCRQLPLGRAVTKAVNEVLSPATIQHPAAIVVVLVTNMRPSDTGWPHPQRQPGAAETRPAALSPGSSSSTMINSSRFES